MSRSKRDILDTESMLGRLADLLRKNGDSAPYGARADAEALRHISMTLHRWHELECGAEDGAIERDEKTGKPVYQSGHNPKIRYAVPDRERGALKRLAAIMARYPALTSYVQGDPRGCALYVLKPGDVPAGEDVSAYYSRGLAVFR